ncbi:hypothetical protein BN2475_250137 [Paraburkholderia ribeironis]|uniref:Uncharacterized protein n=1 Tax=Paraburkholderia ribeironis TaxID=1247936 RepID=A0A1N7RZ17_9BURK|nr:hypothetical protein BN2475_250137 [Paraburkholderia ribeironis]
MTARHPRIDRDPANLPIPWAKKKRDWKESRRQRLEIFFVNEKVCFEKQKLNYSGSVRFYYSHN